MRVILTILFGLIVVSARCEQGSQGSKGFVTRDGARLVLDGNPFRCVGVNIYWLGLDENVGGVSYPSAFRVTDALDTAKVMGANVIRAHTLGVSTGTPLSVEPVLGEFNEKAFQAIDFAIAEAAKRGLKIVIPLTDNYAYYHGGRHNFTDWRALPAEDFYTNREVISDFEQYIEHLLHHRSVFTGLALKDDPAIMAWETGNELRSPSAWTAQISHFLKEQDHAHLVLDGHYGVDPASLDLESVDLVGAHFNGTVFKMTPDAVEKQVVMAAGRRPYFIGEFDWNNHHKTGDLDSFLAAVAANPNIAGATLWSLFPHSDDGGFVHHNDGFSLHYPGDDPAMREKVAKLAAFFRRVVGPSSERSSFLGAPLILSATPHEITWRGTAGADTYDLERSTKGPKGPWATVATDLTDSTEGLQHPKTPFVGWYRMRAQGTDGRVGTYSNVTPRISAER